MADFRGMVKSSVNKRTHTTLTHRPSPSPAPSISTATNTRTSSSTADVAATKPLVDQAFSSNENITIAGSKRKLASMFDNGGEKDTEMLDLTGDDEDQSLLAPPPFTPSKRQHTWQGESADLQKCRKSKFYTTPGGQLAAGGRMVDEEEHEDAFEADEPSPADVDEDEADVEDDEEEEVEETGNSNGPEGSATGLPTPQKTPFKASEIITPKPEELAERYLATPTRNGVREKEPHRFSLKPPFWRRWSPAQYAAFADYLKASFDPSHFAQVQNLPAEEVRYVFRSLVCNPLYDAKEAEKRGEEGWQETVDLYNKYGAEYRHWGAARKEDGKRVFGEIADVQKGCVILTLKSGRKYEMQADKLVDEDEKYLEELSWPGMSYLAVLEGEPQRPGDKVLDPLRQRFARG